MRVSWPYHFLKEVIYYTSRYFYTSRSVGPSKPTVNCQLCKKDVWWVQARRQSRVFGWRHKNFWGDTFCKLSRQTMYQKCTITELLVYVKFVGSVCFAVSHKSICGDLFFWQKFAGTLVLVQKFTLAWGGGDGPEMPTVAPGQGGLQA